MRTIAVDCLALFLFLTGCALNPTASPNPAQGAAIHGNVHGGQQPIVGAHVYLFAANSTAYGAASLSLLNAADTGNSDSIGAYVLTGSDGSFTINGDYTCTAGQQVYLYAFGGNPGAGASSAAGLLAILGNCLGPSFSTSTFVWINEVSTVAAAYAFSGFATDATHVSSSGTALAQVGIQNAFANATNLASLSTGAALATTPALNGTVPQSTINTLANLLAACVNSTGTITGPTNPTTCYTLFNNATSNGTSGGTVPSDTATAAINIAHNPAANIANLCSLQAAVGAAFLPDLGCVSTGNGYPPDFTIAIAFTGAGFNSNNSGYGISIDASGNAWLANWLGSNVDKFSPLGAAISPSGGYTCGGHISSPKAIAIDNSGNVWVANTGTNSVFELSGVDGSAISPNNGYTGGGLFAASGIAIDASGDVWLAGGSAAAEFSSSGTAKSPSGGYSGANITSATSVAIDASGNAWYADDSSGFAGLSKFSNSGSPLASYGGGGITSSTPYMGIGIDASGNIWAVGDTLAKFSSAGTALSPTSGGYAGTVISTPTGLAIDGSGNVWVSNAGVSISEWSNSGAAISPSAGYKGPQVSGSPILSGPESIAVDGSGDVWVGNSNKTVVEFIGAATPVVTPIAVGVKNNTIATRP